MFIQCEIAESLFVVRDRCVIDVWVDGRY